MATRIMLKGVTMAFPALAEPQAFGEGEPAYGAKFPIAVDSEHQKLIEEAMLAEAKEAWKDKASSVLTMLAEDGKLAFTKKVYRSKKTGEAYQGFEGKHYLSARNAKTQPSVYNQYGEEVSGKDNILRQAFSGAIVNASVEIWAQDNKWGRRINCSLRGVMLTGEGENFGGGSTPASADEFSALAKAKAEAEDIL
jgi:uncharacterized protein YdbL (DUF1318 family)